MVLTGISSRPCLTRTFNKLFYTSTMTLRAVSAPRLNSVPGTLLLIVAGITTIGIRNA